MAGNRYAKYLEQQEGGVFSMPADPLEVAQKQASIASQTAGVARTQQQMAQDAATFDAQRQAAEAEAQLRQLELEKIRREQQANSPYNPGAMAEVRLDARDKLRDIRTIRANMEQPGAVGDLLTPLMQMVPGTAAKTVQANVGTVAKSGALAKILEMTRATGKNPFTPMSNSDVQLIADTQGALDPTLAEPEFNRQLNKFEGAHRRAYLGAGGRLRDIYPPTAIEPQRAEGEARLRANIQRMLPTIPPAKRDAFVADAWRRFNDSLGPRRGIFGGGKGGKKASGGAQFLGFE